MSKHHTKSKTSTDTSSASTSMTRSMTSSFPYTTTSLTTSSNIPSPTTSERKGQHSGKALGVVGVLGAILMIVVLAVVGVVWRRQRQHKAIKARMLASSQTTFQQKAMALESRGSFRANPYLSLNRGRNEPSESSANLVHAEDHGHSQDAQRSESQHRPSHYQPTSGYSYPGERVW